MRDIKKTRWFVVADWNTACDYTKVLEKKQISYIGAGRAEHCPDTDRLHSHLYVRFYNPKWPSNKILNQIGDMWGPIHCWAKPMYGKIEENEAYSSKDHEGKIDHYGSLPKQGLRCDLIETKDEILKGNLTVDEIIVEDPEFYHQYGRTMRELETIHLRSQWRKWMTEGVWYTGESGSGKSHSVFADYDPKTHYVKNLQDEWWDGYKGQEIVILNEFNFMPKAELMDLVDKWPKTVKQRCREPVPFLAREVRITSIKSPYEIYGIEEDDWEFNRRFNVITLEQRCSEGNIRTSEHLCSKVINEMKCLGIEYDETYC
jgi:hypothetical protein